MQRTVPILHIDSYEEAKAYYVDWLGFKIDWEFRSSRLFPSICRCLAMASCFIYRSTRVEIRFRNVPRRGR